VHERGQTVLKLAADQASAKSFEVETKMVEQHPVEALVAEAKASDTRMIVVGNQGAPSPIAGAILGAVPFKLVHLSPVPVLVVPPS
jgi:nucleotide-binding universal stress UspA family protein